MEACVIVTYRCNDRCQMCHTWKYPSHREEKILPSIMEELPTGLKKIKPIWRRTCIKGGSYESIRNDMICKGFERVKRFSWKSAAEQTLKVFEALHKK